MRSLSDKVNADIRPQVGFALFVTWLALLPRTVVANSTIVYTNPLVLGITFMLFLTVLAIVDGAGKDRTRSVAFGLYTILATLAGLVFLIVPNSMVRLICFGLEMVAAAGLLLCWGRLLSTCPLKEIFLHAIGGLACTALFYGAIASVGALTSTAENLYTLSNMMLISLSIVPALSALLGWPRIHAIPPTSITSRSRLHYRPNLPFSYLLILCFAAFLTSFVSGFIYLPYHYDWNLMACLKSGILLLAACAAGLYIVRQPIVTLSHINAFLLFGLLLTIVGFSLITWGTTEPAFIARTLLEAARDCYFAIAFTLLCGVISQYRIPFFPVFALGMLGTGLFWSYDIGMAARKILGYDLSILAPIISVCSAALAVAFFLSFVYGPLRPEFDAARARAHAYPRSATDGFTYTETPLDEDGEIRLDDPQDQEDSPTSLPDDGLGKKEMHFPLDATSARQVIEKTYEELLAPYKLSPRELQVSMLMLDGYTAAAASEKLGISIATIKFHLGNSYRKIGIQSKSELVELTRGTPPEMDDTPEEAVHED